MFPAVVWLVVVAVLVTGVAVAVICCGGSILAAVAVAISGVLVGQIVIAFFMRDVSIVGTLSLVAPL